MSCVLELTAMKEEVVCVHCESIKESLSPLYQLAYDLLLGFHDVKRHSVALCVYIYVCVWVCIYIYMCVCVRARTRIYTHTHIPTHIYRYVMFLEN